LNTDVVKTRKQSQFTEFKIPRTPENVKNVLACNFHKLTKMILWVGGKGREEGKGRKRGSDRRGKEEQRKRIYLCSRKFLL